MFHRLADRVYALATLGLLAASSVAAAGLGIKNGKVAVSSPDGLSDATYTYVPHLLRLLRGHLGEL